MAGDAQDFTVDAFHRGAFYLVQPAAGGHRAGMDAMVLAAAVPDDFEGRLADFGAGAGAAGIAVLSRCTGTTAVLVERSARMTGFAQATLDHEGNSAISERATIIEADVSAPAEARRRAGLEENSFDFAIMNPPFNAGHDRRTPDAMKADAHVMENDLPEMWARSAASLVKPGGGFAVIARPQSMAEWLDALSGRFGALQVRPVHAYAGKPAIRIVIRGHKGSRAQLSLEPPLILHREGADGFTKEADAIINGLAALY